MDEAQYVTVLDVDDIRGRASLKELEDEDVRRVWIDFDEERVQVPTDLLVLEDDDRYRLRARLADFQGVEATEEVVLPVAEEVVSFRTEERETGKVRVKKTVREEEQVVGVPLTSTEVEVQRVAVDRMVDELVSERREGDTLILPVYEEVLVVEKKLRLKEEIHITTKQTTREHAEHVTLRKEEVAIERDETDEDLV